VYENRSLDIDIEQTTTSAAVGALTGFGLAGPVKSVLMGSAGKQVGLKVFAGALGGGVTDLANSDSGTEHGVSAAAGAVEAVLPESPVTTVLVEIGSAVIQDSLDE
jgi:hypothetical protein